MATRKLRVKFGYKINKPFCNPLVYEIIFCPWLRDGPEIDRGLVAIYGTIRLINRNRFVIVNVKGLLYGIFCECYKNLLSSEDRLLMVKYYRLMKSRDSF